MRVQRSTRIVAAALIASAAFFCRGAIAAETVPLPRGHVVFKTDFEAADALKAWSNTARLEAGCLSAHALAVERKADDAGARLLLVLPADKLRGHRLLCTANVRGENVSAKPQPWNGVKLMLIIESPSRKDWPQAEIPVGTFPWQRAAFNARIPADASALTLFVGLEAVTGKAWLDDIAITVARPPIPPAPKPAAGPPFKGHELPRLRGAMINPSIDAASLRVLGQEWNANLIRWQLINYVGAGKRVPLEKYDAWLDGELAKLDAALPHCERFGLRVALDLHSPPGGKGTTRARAGRRP